MHNHRTQTTLTLTPCRDGLTPILVGVSGGPDSMAMLALLLTSPPAPLLQRGVTTRHTSLQENGECPSLQERDLGGGSLHVCCLDHATRPETVDEVSFVRAYAETHGCQFHTARYTGIDHRERTMRKWRHEQFIHIAKKVGATKVFLGHNLTDRIETTLLNMARGCHLEGFLALRPIQPHFLDPSITIVRPLLSYPKRDIQAFCDQRQIPYYTDPTNTDPMTSKRNMLRHQILPSLADLGSQQSLERSFVAMYSEVETIHELSVQKSEGSRRGEHGSPSQHIEKLKTNLHPDRHAERGYEILMKNEKWKMKNSDDDPTPSTISSFVVLLKDLGIYRDVSQGVLTEIWRFLTISTSGYTWRNGTYFFVCHGKRYVIKGPKEFWKKQEETGRDGNKKEDVMSRDALHASISIIRYPQPGDRFRGKKLSSWLIDKKVPIFRRPRVQIIEQNGEIVDVILPNILACNEGESV